MTNTKSWLVAKVMTKAVRAAAKIDPTLAARLELAIAAEMQRT